MGEETNAQATDPQALLFASMAAVLGEIRRVPKNGRNDFHKYDYVTEGDLVDAVRNILSEHGMSFWPSVVEHKEEEIKNARGKTEFKATVTISVTFAHSAGGSMTTTWVGQGVDASDKAYYKAYTGAVKYALMKTFMVSTGDDPEQEASGPIDHSSDPEWQRATKRWYAIAGGTELSKAEIEAHKEWVKGRLGVSSSKHMTAKHWQQAGDRINDEGGNAAQWMRDRLKQAKGAA